MWLNCPASPARDTCTPFRQAGSNLPWERFRNLQGIQVGQPGWPGSCWDPRPSEDVCEEGVWVARPPLPLGSQVMALQTWPLLLLTLSLCLAHAQKTLEQVPVQPDFDAQKVAVLLQAQTWPRDEDTGASVACRLHSGTGRQTTRDGGGHGGFRSRHSLWALGTEGPQATLAL